MLKAVVNCLVPWRAGCWEISLQRKVVFEESAEVLVRTELNIFKIILINKEIGGHYHYIK